MNINAEVEYLISKTRTLAIKWVDSYSLKFDTYMSDLISCSYTKGNDSIKYNITTHGYNAMYTKNSNIQIYIDKADKKTFNTAIVTYTNSKQVTSDDIYNLINKTINNKLRDINTIATEDHKITIHFLCGNIIVHPQDDQTNVLGFPIRIKIQGV